MPKLHQFKDVVSEGRTDLLESHRLVRFRTEFGRQKDRRACVFGMLQLESRKTVLTEQTVALCALVGVYWDVPTLAAQQALALRELVLVHEVLQIELHFWQRLNKLVNLFFNHFHVF